MQNIIVTLGTGLKTPDDFHKALKLSDVILAETGSDLLDVTTFEEATPGTRLKLALVTVAELGFGMATFPEICARAFKRGLWLCPAEVAPQLCLQRPCLGKMVIIAMEPIFNSIWGRKDIFFISDRMNDGQLWLYATPGEEDRLFDEHSTFAFAFPLRA